MRTIFTLFTLCLVTAAQAQVDLKNASNTLLGSYASVGAAYAAIPASISEAYTIELTATYNSSAETFPVTLVNKTGASTTNTITIRPAAGVNNVSIAGASATGSTILKLVDADFIIIDGRAGGTGNTKALTISNSNTGSATSVIELSNGSSDNSIRYCNINGAYTSSATRGIYIRGIVAGNTSGNSNNIIDNCLFSGSYSMINIVSASAAAFFNDRNIIKNCEMVNTKFNGIWLQAGVSNTVIDSCKLHCTAAAGYSSTGSFGILVDFQSGDLDITRNYISINNGTNTTKVRAISLRSTGSVSTARVFNNFISLVHANATSATVGAIEFGDNNLDDPFTANIYFNTILLGGTHTNGASGAVLSSAFIFTETFANNAYDIANNIVINQRTGPAGVKHVAYWIPAAGSLGTKVIDYNTYNIQSEDFAVLGTTTYNGFATYQAAMPGNETNSNTTTVQLVSTTDLHLTGTSIGNQGLAGNPIGAVPTDIDGETRDVIPYRGADEVASAPLPVVIASLQALPVNNTVALRWTTASESNTARFDVERSLTGNQFSFVGTVAAAGNSAAPLTYSYMDQEVLSMYSGRDLYYRLKTTDKDGRYSYSPVLLIKANETKPIALSAYPNPFSGWLSVRITSAKPVKANISVTDAMGRVVYTQTRMLPQGTSLVPLQALQHVPKGSYYLVLDAGGEKLVTAIVKQ